MAIANLPYPNMDFVPLDILTATELDQLVANIEAINNSNITTTAIANRAVTPAKIDASAYGHFARDNDGGSQAYTADTDTIALLPNSVLSEVGCSYSAGVFTVSQAGIWAITGGGRASSGASYGYVRILINGTSTVVAGGTGYASSSVVGTFNGAVSWVGHLSAGDTVSLQIRSHLALTNNTARQQHLEGVCIHADNS